VNTICFGRLEEEMGMGRKPLETSDATGEDGSLLEIFLAVAPPERAGRFASTARTASLTGLSQRTIQQWIQIGAIRAVQIGEKYQVDLRSLKTFLEARSAKDR
jgi:excisionase family DNA binding protein